MDEFRGILTRMRRRGHIDGVLVLVLLGLMDRIEALEQAGRTAIRGDFFPRAPLPIVAAQEPQEHLCPICLTRKLWGIEANTAKDHP